MEKKMMSTRFNVKLSNNDTDLRRREVLRVQNSKSSLRHVKYVSAKGHLILRK